MQGSHIVTFVSTPIVDEGDHEDRDEHEEGEEGEGGAAAAAGRREARAQCSVAEINI